MPVSRRLALALVGGVLTACAAGGPSASPNPSETTAMPTLSPAPTPASSPIQQPSSAPANTVSVTITDLSGWSGATLAAILYDGTWRFVGYGSFVAKVDADPFTITATLLAAPPFPYPQPSAAAPAYVPAGTHTLVVVVAWTLKPFGEWLPANPLNLHCEVPVTVPVGSGIHVQVADLQSAEGGPRTCQTEALATQPEAPASEAVPASPSAAPAPVTTGSDSSPWFTVLPVTLLIAIASLLVYDWLAAEQRWRRSVSRR